MFIKQCEIFVVLPSMLVFFSHDLLAFVYGGTTVLPAKGDSGVMFCLQIYQGLRIDRSLVY